MRTKKILACIIASLIVFLSLTPTYANAASSSEIRSQINELKKERETIQEQITEVKEQYQQRWRNHPQQGWFCPLSAGACQPRDS